MEKRPKNVSEILKELEEAIYAENLDITQGEYRKLLDFTSGHLRHQISSLIEAKIEEMEGEKLTHPSFTVEDAIHGGNAGDIQMAEDRDANNEAITRAQSILKEALV